MLVADRLREAAEAEALARKLAEEEAERVRKEEEAAQREAARIEALRLEQEARLKVMCGLRRPLCPNQIRFLAPQTHMQMHAHQYTPS